MEQAERRPADHAAPKATAEGDRQPVPGHCSGNEQANETHQQYCHADKEGHASRQAENGVSVYADNSGPHHDKQERPGKPTIAVRMGKLR
jgi:hypothetical protein